METFLDMLKLKHSPTRTVAVSNYLCYVFCFFIQIYALLITAIWYTVIISIKQLYEAILSKVIVLQLQPWTAIAFASGLPDSIIEFASS